MFWGWRWGWYEHWSLKCCLKSSFWPFSKQNAVFFIACEIFDSSINFHLKGVNYKIFVRIFLKIIRFEWKSGLDSAMEWLVFLFLEAVYTVNITWRSQVWEVSLNVDFEHCLLTVTINRLHFIFSKASFKEAVTLKLSVISTLPTIIATLI